MNPNPLIAADGGGGALSLIGRLVNSTVSGNSSPKNGGGLAGRWTIENSTITGNRSDADGNGTGSGGGISAFQPFGTPPSDTTLFNSIIAGNIRGAVGAEVPDDIQLAASALPPGSAFNLIGDPNSAGGLTHGTNGNIVGDGSGNVLDIHSVLDTTLADNGGPTLTHRLVLGSPALNAGDPLFDPNATNPPINFDQRGTGFARAKDGRLDIGAFEGLHDPAPVDGLIVVTTLDDVIDSEDGLWSLREAVIYANTHAEDNVIQLPAGTYTLTRKGASENAALTGDLDIVNNGSLKIIGASSATTIIDASGLFDAGLGTGDRAFEVFDFAEVRFEELTVTGGQSQSGGGISASEGLIEIAGSSIVSNSAPGSLGIGGGVYVGSGSLLVVGTTIAGNRAEFGGGIYTGQLVTLTVDRCVISENTATDSGGGILASTTFRDAQFSVFLKNNLFFHNAAQGAEGRGGAVAVARNLGGGPIVDIDNCVFEANQAYDGAAFHTRAADLTVNASRFIQNTSSSGALALAENGRLTVTDSEFADNTGSGISTLSEATIVGCTFTNNSASPLGRGGGISTTATLIVRNSTITGNTASRGGGIYALRLLFLEDSTVSENEASDAGGGVYAGFAWINRSTVSNNSLVDPNPLFPLNGGGGVFSLLGRMFNSTVSGNSSPKNGGGLAGIWTIQNSTIVGNRSDADGNGTGAGGGINVSQPSGNPPSDTTLFTSIVAGNVRGAVGADVPDDIHTAAASLPPGSAFNLIGDPNSAGGLVHGVNGNIVGDGSGNLLDIHTVLDTTLADNGGHTFTHALVPGSPALNAGDPLFDPNLPLILSPALFTALFDQRAAGYSRVSGGRVDIGAFEFGTTFQAVVVGRSIFYDGSLFDHNMPGPNAADALAIAPDKSPLLPNGNLATAANVTNYSSGINGIMIDLAGSHPDITAADFLFHIGNKNAPETWAVAPQPASVTVLAGQGVSGADRIVITWPAGAIKNTWLEVQVLATAQTGLAASDVFYWGNKVADSFAPGSSVFDTTSTDAAQVYKSIGNSARIDNPRDYNRDGVINSTDAALVNANIGSIVRLSIPAMAAPQAQIATSEFSAGPLATVANRDDSRAAIASALAQPLAARTAESPSPVTSSVRREVAKSDQRLAAAPAITESQHLEALNAASDSLEEILHELEEALCGASLGELL